VSDEPLRIGELLRQTAPQLGLGAAATAGHIWKLWPEVAGPAIAARAEPSSLRDGVLRVRVDQPAWATELGYLAPLLKERLNRALGAELIAEVRIWIGPPARTTGPAREPHRPAQAARPLPPPADLDEAIARAYQAWRKRYGRASEER
jgi:predicted nucleic acid-binding Zn ribbon protein